MSVNRDPDMFDVRAALRTVRDAVAHHRRVVLATALLTLAATIAYVWLWPPVFKAEATVFVERDNDATRDAFYATWNVFRKDDARTEIELMTSGSVLRQVIAREHLKYEDVYHPFLSQARWLWERSWPGRLYKAVRGAVVHPDPDAPGEADVELGKTIDDMAAGITIKPVGDSNVGKITVKGPSRRVAKIANTLVDVYLADRAERYRREAQKAYDILTEEVGRAERSLREISDRRLAFAQKNGLAFDFQKETQELKQLTDLEGDIAKSRAKLATLDASLGRIDHELGSEPAMQKIAAVSELNALRQAAESKRMELQIALAQGEGRYREDSPEMRDLRADIARLDGVVASTPERVEKGATEGINAVHQQLVESRDSLQAERDGVAAGLRVMEGTAASLRRALDTVPGRQQVLRDLDREYTLAQEVYQALLMKRAQSGVSIYTANAAMPSMRVVDYATVPGARSWPKNKLLFPAALAFGLLLGAAAAVVTSWFEARVRAADLEEGRAGLPLYATVGVSSHRPPLTLVERGGRGGAA